MGRRSLVAVGAAVAVLAVIGAVVGWALGSRSERNPGGTPQSTNTPSPDGTGRVGGDEACGGFSDEFDTMDARWQQQNPSTGTFGIEDGAVVITAREGADLYPGFVAAPMLVRVPTGGYAVETRVAFHPRHSYQGAGLVLYQSSREYVRLERGFGAHGAIIFEYAVGGKHTKVAGPFGGSKEKSIRTEAAAVELRLVKNGRTIGAAWRVPDGPWQDIGTATLAADQRYAVGPAVMNRAQPPYADPSKSSVKARFDYVRVSCVADPG